MDVYCIIIDTRLMARHLPRCLAALQPAIERFPDRLEVRLVSKDANPALESLARRTGAQFAVIHMPSTGARNNEMARRTPATVLLFPISYMRLGPAWLDDIESLLDQRQWDAVLLTPHKQSPALSLKRLWQRNQERGTFCVRRDWFERIGGFDPTLDEGAHSDLVVRLRACQARVLELSI